MEIPYRGSGKVYYNSKEYQCDLYYSEKAGGIVLKLNVKNPNTIGSFLEVPLEIQHLCGNLDSGFKYTLLNLRRINTEDLISYGMSVYTYSASYILCGVGGKEIAEQTFYKVCYTLANIIEWGGESVYAISEKYGLCSKGEDIKQQIYCGNGFSVSYLVYGSFLPCVDHELLSENIEIKQHGVIEICFDKEEPLSRFNTIFEKVKRLLEISMRRRVAIESVNAYSHEICDNYGDTNIERSINIFGEDIEENSQKTVRQSHRWKWITLKELIAQNSFEYYFTKHEKLAPIIELFLEPFYVEKSSETRVFLNLVQALETYHSRFITNDLSEFKTRVDELLSSHNVASADKYKKYLLAKSKSFITLESRLADLLLAEWKTHFDTGRIKHSEFPMVISQSRNYYIHYDEEKRKKNRILSTEELEIYNSALIQILEYYILLEIGFTETNGKLIKRIAERWGNVSQHLDILEASQNSAKQKS